MRTLVIVTSCLSLAACGDLNLGSSFGGETPEDAGVSMTDSDVNLVTDTDIAATDTDEGREPTDRDETDRDETDRDETDRDETDREPPTPSCENTCEPGDSVCADGEISRCEWADGCFIWSKPTACMADGCDTADSCKGCLDECATSETLCEAGLLQSCKLSASGCNVWSEASACPVNSCADDSSCQTCTDECHEPLACEDGSSIACRRGPEGCLVLDAAACPEPVLSADGAPCTDNAECKSDRCLPTADDLSLCCAHSCDDDEVCADDGAECLEAPVCDSGTRCSNGDYQGCVDGDWALIEDCTAGCSTEAGGCLPAAGEPCTAQGGCGEGSCQTASNGEQICCSANCGQACKSCAPDGKSCVNEADDEACGPLTCPSDSTCRDYTATSVTSERCIDGQCASPAQLCAFTARAAGEACSSNELCDAAGNCSVPKLALGEACTADETCGSGFCVDGVCCANACDGVCMECRAGTGQCDVVPAQESGCAPVDCSGFDTECSSSEGIGAGQCRQLGVCKTPDDCVLDFASKGTSCQGDPMVCDGQGNCEQPEVQCGSTTCTTGVTGDACCYTSMAPDVSAPACIAETDPCVESSTDWLVLCDEHSDCRTGEELCCVVATPTFRRLACTPPDSCNVWAPQGISVVELCESPLMPKRDCSLGTECSAAESTMPGFTFCTLP